MPFIDDEELMSLQKQIDVAVDQKEEAEIEIEELQEEISSTRKKGMISNIIFGVLAGIGLGGAAFLFFNGSGASSAEIEAIKIAEQERVVDSLATIAAEAEAAKAEEEPAESGFDGENAKADVKDGTKDQKVYSVQIKALTDNQHPVMSSAIAGLATKDEYFKYTVGLFNSLEEAHELRQELVNLGFRDAFVASYVNGERQEIHKPGE